LARNRRRVVAAQQVQEGPAFEIELSVGQQRPEVWAGIVGVGMSVRGM
jgi:hypothetical protein